jgi:uncharacterized protein (DUF1330 family)
VWSVSDRGTAGAFDRVAQIAERKYCRSEARPFRLGHAQVKKVYFISESEVVDRAEVPAWNTAVQKAIKDAGGSLVVGENITAVLGDPPKRVGITEFPSVEKAKAWVNSSERKAMQPQRDKAVKFVRQYIVEAQ